MTAVNDPGAAADPAVAAARPPAGRTARSAAGVGRCHHAGTPLSKAGRR